MSNEFLLSMIGALIVIVVFVRMAGWMEQTADLRLSLFRPYRGDPWPQGVQEEDGVTWRWTRAEGRAAPQPPAGPDALPVLLEGDATSGPNGHPGAERVARIRVGRPDTRR